MFLYIDRIYLQLLRRRIYLEFWWSELVLLDIVRGVTVIESPN